MALRRSFSKLTGGRSYHLSLIVRCSGKEKRQAKKADGIKAKVFSSEAQGTPILIDLAARASSSSSGSSPSILARCLEGSSVVQTSIEINAHREGSREDLVGIDSAVFSGLFDRSSTLSVDCAPLLMDREHVVEPIGVFRCNYPDLT